MAFNAGAILASLNINISGFTAGMQQAGQQLSKFASSFNKFASLSPSVQGLSKDFRDLDRVVGGILISQAFYRAAQGIEQAATAVLRFSSNMQEATIAMSYFLGTDDKARDFVEIMKDFAAQTPFATEQALKLSRNLMAMGFASDSVKSVMTIMTDAASATGGTAQQMDRVVLALGQMKTNGYIAGQELRQLAEAGIPVYKILQEELGLTAKQMKDIGKMKISGDIGVQAVLTGLEKRYKGASDRIAETLRGMWATIGDDALIVSEKMFKVPFAALDKFVRKVRDTFETAREAATTGGFGGVFEKLIPPSLQGAIKTISAAIMSLGDSIGKVIDAFKPVAAAIGNDLLWGISVVLPAIAALARSISTFVKAAMEFAPIRVFAYAVGSLLVATFAARALALLWSVTRIGFICTAVAEAVNILRLAIYGLYAVITKNPVARIVLIIAGALLAVATSSQVVAQWLDEVMAKLSALGGVSTDGLFDPEHNKSITEMMDGFDTSITNVGEDLTGVGKAAEKAGKKVKEGFVASFDEVFQIPDKAGEGLDDLAAAMANFNPGKPGGGVKPGTIADWKYDYGKDKPPFTFPDIPPPGKPGGNGPDKIDLPPLTWPPGGGPDAVMASMANMNQYIEQQAQRLGANVNAGLVPVGNAILAVIASVQAGISTAMATVMVPVVTLVDLFTQLRLGAAAWATTLITDLATVSAGFTQLGTTVTSWGAGVLVDLLTVATGITQLKVTVSEMLNAMVTDLAKIPVGISLVQVALEALVASLVLNSPIWAAAWAAMAISVGISTVQIQTSVTTMWDNIQSTFNARSLTLQNSWSTFWSNMPSAVISNGAVINISWANVLATMATNFSVSSVALNAAWTLAFSALVTYISGPFAANSAKAWLDALESMRVISESKLSEMQNRWKTHFNELEATISSWQESVQLSWSSFLSRREKAMRDSIETEASAWAKHLLNVKTSMQTTWAAIQLQVETSLAAMSLAVQTKLSEVQTFIDTTLTSIQTTVQSIWTSVATTWNTSLETIKQLTQSFLDFTLQNIPAGFRKSISEPADQVHWATVLSFDHMWETLQTTFPKALDTLKGFWENNKTEIITIAGFMTGGIAAEFALLAPRVAPLLEAIIPAARSILPRLTSAAEEMVSAIVNVFSGLGSKLQNAVTNALANAKAAAAAGAASIGIGGGVAAGASGGGSSSGDSGSVWDLPYWQGQGSNVSGFATGGIINKDSIVRVGERGRQEAIIPLSGEAMSPFAEAIGSVLGPLIDGSGGANNRNQPNDNRPILYVGNLIADKASLKELYRQIKVIELSEQTRGGV